MITHTEPLWPNHVANAPDEVFVTGINGWDVWLNRVEGDSFVNVNITELGFFTIGEDPYPDDTPPEVRSFREQFTHLIDENFRFMAQAAGEPPPMEKGAIEQMKGRDEIRAALKASHDYGAKVWARLTDQTAMEMIPGRHVYLTARAQASILIPGCRPEGLHASGRRPVTAASQGHPQAL